MFRPLAIVVAASLTCAVALCADPASLPPPGADRTPSRLIADWQILSEELRGVLPSPLTIIDEERRAEVAPAAIPLLRRAISLNAEIYQVVPQARSECRQKHYQFLAVLSLLNDPAAISELDDARESNVREIATFGRQAWYRSRWWKSVGHPEAADALLTEIESLAKTSPEDDQLAGILLGFREDGLVSPAQDKRIRQIIGQMAGPMARAAADQLKAADKRASLIGKPLLIAAQTVDGKAFTTQSLAGRPILIHFGRATSEQWQEQHNVLLQATRPADLAIVTVFCDDNASDLRNYIARHREIPWPALWPKENPAGFAAQYGIEQLPNCILIGPDGKVIATDILPTEETLAALIPSPSDTTK